MQNSKCKISEIRECCGFAPSPCTKIIFTILGVGELKMRISYSTYQSLVSRLSSLVPRLSSKKKSRKILDSSYQLVLRFLFFQDDMFQDYNHDNAHHKAIADDWPQERRNSIHRLLRSERKCQCEHNRNTQNESVTE